MPGEQRQPRSGTEWSVLALLCERPSHGFALARALAPEGEVGRVWSSTRPLVYRALDQLASAGLVREAGSEAGDRGPRRTLLEPTAQGAPRSPPGSSGRSSTCGSFARS
ncbi:MAG: PadR family transcriptional regulator [Thermoleophilia bacterium]